MSSELLMCGGGVRSCSDCVEVCWNVCFVSAVVKNSVFLALEC